MLQSDPEAWMCSPRYLSPHGEDYMRLVAEELDQMGALKDGHIPTQEEHELAIGRARTRYRAA